MPKKPIEVTQLTPEHVEKLKNATRFMYDLQGLRMQTGARAAKQAEAAHLDDKDKLFLAERAVKLQQLEDDAKKEMLRLLRGVPIWENWLKTEVKGVGPAMASVLLTEFDIRRSEYPSQMWAYSGLAVDPETGRAVRRVRGKRLNYNPWLKSKMLEVLGKCLIKAKNDPYHTKVYIGRKFHRQNKIIPVCMGCGGLGKRQRTDEEHTPEKGEKKGKVEAVCWNCEGTGGPAKWGADDAHREIDARRYMVKMFLLEFWRRWREAEGLPIRPSYAEEKLGIVHHRDWSDMVLPPPDPPEVAEAKKAAKAEKAAKAKEKAAGKRSAKKLLAEAAQAMAAATAAMAAGDDEDDDDDEGAVDAPAATPKSGLLTRMEPHLSNGRPKPIVEEEDDLDTSLFDVEEPELT